METAEIILEKKRSREQYWLKLNRIKETTERETDT